jgi:prophage antirepressor-like protein
MNELMTIQNVRGYMKDGTAYLNLEDVARGLGFTTVATSGNECVRWTRVVEYLGDMKYFISGKGDLNDEYIPENIFYRLAMKAKNETAEKFQALVADEILPSIRKTGSYSVKPVSPLEALRQTVEALEQQEKRLNQIESTQQAIKAAVISESDNWREDIRHKMNRIAQRIGTNKYREVRSESYKVLEQRAGVDLERRMDNKRARMLKEGASQTAISNIKKIDIIDEDKKLREIYGKIVSEYLIRYVA